MTTEPWSETEIADWFAARVPAVWFLQGPNVRIDRDEIVVIGELAAPPRSASSADPNTPESAMAPKTASTDHDVARVIHITGFRESTRDERMTIADEAEVLWNRKISWGVHCDGLDLVFTSQSVPVMTRLRMDERAVVDTLIAVGVARSRSEALAWCVRLVGQHQGEWIAQLRDAMAAVDRIRAEGPQA